MAARSGHIDNDILQLSINKFGHAYIRALQHLGPEAHVPNVDSVLPALLVSSGIGLSFGVAVCSESDDAGSDCGYRAEHCCNPVCGVPIVSSEIHSSWRAESPPTESRTSCEGGGCPAQNRQQSEFSLSFGIHGAPCGMLVVRKILA
ncbi:hypothetical protein [Stenotrophomonas sepilia]|uniref:hypothetical protein n=1 Tax=Stenotrophomonas sepilia TaxID=2860290 RepID=UPI002E7617A3|nr:hypothetical protein [Stenotrophomonas sepilia]